MANLCTMAQASTQLGDIHSARHHTSLQLQQAQVRHRFTLHPECCPGLYELWASVRFSARTYQVIVMGSVCHSFVGITPIFGVVRAALSAAQDPARVTLIYACRSEQDMLLKSEVKGCIVHAANRLLDC
jgi:hypothetical protein